MPGGRGDDEVEIAKKQRWIVPSDKAKGKVEEEEYGMEERDKEAKARDQDRNRVKNCAATRAESQSRCHKPASVQWLAMASHRHLPCRVTDREDTRAGASFGSVRPGCATYATRGSWHLMHF